MESELRAELEAQRLRNAELEEQVQQLRTRAVELVSDFVC